MSITVLTDVIMPDAIVAAAAQGKQRRRNHRVGIESGEMQVNIVWSRTLRQYEIGIIPMSVSAWQTLEGLHEVTEGGAKGFLMLDPKDSSATDTDGMASLISAPAHTYQLFKRYTSVGSSQTKDRNITRPIASGFILKISGTPTGSYTLDTATGIITIPSDPAAANVTWSGSFYVPVHFASDEIDWTLERAGPADTRLMSGSSIVLAEVKE